MDDIMIESKTGVTSFGKYTDIVYDVLTVNAIKNRYASSQKVQDFIPQGAVVLCTISWQKMLL
jgi:hypothetical protein